MNDESNWIMICWFMRAIMFKGNDWLGLFVVWLCVPFGIVRIEIGSSMWRAKANDSKFACYVDLVFGHKRWMSHKLKINWVTVYFGVVLPALEIEPISIDTLLDRLPLN